MKKLFWPVLSILGVLFCAPLRAQTAPTNPRTIERSANDSESPLRVALSPDGLVAALSISSERGPRGHKVRLLDAATGRVLQEIFDHKTFVSALLFSPDGQQLLSQDQDGGTFLSEVATGRRLKQLIAPKTGAGQENTSDADTFFAWSRDGKQLLSGPNSSNYSTVGQWKIWDAQTGEARVLAPASQSQRAGRFSSDGSVIIAEMEKKQVLIRRLDPSNGRELSRAVFGESLGFELSPDGQWLLSILTENGRTDRRAENDYELWDVPTRRKLATLKGQFTHHLFSADGKTLVTTNYDGHISLRDLSPNRYGALRRELPPFPNGELDDLAISADANRIFSLDSFAPARLWSVNEPVTPLRYPLRATWDAGYQSQGALSADGTYRTVYAMGRIPSTRLEVRERKDGVSTRWQVPLDDDHLSLEPLQLAANGKNFAALWRGKKEIRIEIYDLDQRALLCSWKAPEKLAGVSFSPDGLRLAVASSQGEIEVRDGTGKKILEWNAAAGSVENIAWSPDAARIATLGDGALSLWNASDGQEQKTVSLGARATLAWSPDSRQIAVVRGPKDNLFKASEVSIVSAQSGEVERHFPISGPVRFVKFSPDGTILGVNNGSEQAVLHLFRTRDGSKIEVPNDDCDAYNFTWTAPSELAIDTGGRLKIWELAPDTFPPKRAISQKMKKTKP